MPCWAAPTVAAEIWGISLERVMAGIAEGTIHSRVDGQFLFVWIPSGDEPATPPPPAFASPRKSARHVAAEIPILTEQEREALASGFNGAVEASAVAEGSAIAEAFSMDAARSAAEMADDPNWNQETLPEPFAMNQGEPQAIASIPAGIVQMAADEPAPDSASEMIGAGLDVSQWRLGRLQAGRLRRPPRLALAS